MELVEQYQEKNIFKCTEGRKGHKVFPTMKANLMETLDLDSYNKWIKKNVLKFSKMNIYKKSKHVCTGV